ncbi:MAG: DegT/DnrJ/EryC1/StrS family aminotransferase [Bacteroidetes bacterium]|nr:DegT/DnrJ/EryC1/StrS family aminotransferase [Bacteroidota bacterium]
MNVPFTDLKKQNELIREEAISSITDIIDNSSFILGKSVKEFEEDFAAEHGVKHCIAVSSGTDANHLALWANGITHGDEVIIPANTFIATAWGATLCGAVPVFADCDARSYNIDPVKAEEKITDRTKAIVAVHLYGQTADINNLRDTAERKNILLIEDAAQAHIAEYKGKKAGSLSAAASFSFYPGKNLGAFGEGGAVTTDNDELAKKIRMLRDHGSEKKYYHEFFGHNYRMEGIQGAVLGLKLKHLSEWTEKRRAAASKYRELLSGIEQITLPEEMDYGKHVYHLFVILFSKRDELQNYLNENGISTGLHYPVPLHLQKCFSHLGYRKNDFPVTEKIAEQCLSLPMFPDISDDQINYVCEKIKHFLKR